MFSMLPKIRIFTSTKTKVVKVQSTLCPRSLDPFYIVSYYIKWVTTSWTLLFCLHATSYLIEYVPIELGSLISLGRLTIYKVTHKERILGWIYLFLY